MFRSDSDATHSPMFHQMEGLVVDKGSLLYGFAVGSIVYWITDFLHWCWTKFKKHREKKRQAAKQPEE